MAVSCIFLALACSFSPIGLKAESILEEAEEEAEKIGRATELTIKEGVTEAEKKAEQLLHQTREDLHEAGHWVKEHMKKVESDLQEGYSAVSRKILKEEEKLDYWLEGRPLSDIQKEALIAHNNLLVTNEFPSAQQCAECHPGQYRQWAVSQHAYAQLSPVFNAMSERINRLTNGTNGDFCIRCHTEVGMALNEPIFTANENRSPVSREGITCIVCHRLKNAYGRVSGRLGLEKGNLTAPMYGPLGDEVLKEVLDNFEVTTKYGEGTHHWKEDNRQVIHSGSVKVKTFASPQLCSNCHDVNSQNIFRLEEAYSQFRNSPSAAKGEVCQDCHMGKVLGKVSGYDRGPIAYIGGQPTPEGKRTNHMFAGPDYTIVHPGIFPHNPEAESIASFTEWLQFDVEAGWGSDAFEDNIPEGTEFPPVWKDSRHRQRGWEFIQGQLRLIGEYRAQSFRTLRYGYRLGDMKVTKNNKNGIEFSVEIKNGTDGHNVPTGFDAERLVFLEVTVRDRRGKAVFKSGDRDPNGDVRDMHSEYVNKGLLPEDEYLANLQSLFLERLLRGGEREKILPVPTSQGALPFLRPNTASSLLISNPPNTRKQSRSIPPNGKHVARYEVEADQLSGYPPYTVHMRLIAQMVPVNLIREIHSVGFDYNLTLRDVANRVVQGGFPLYSRTVRLKNAPMRIDLAPSEAEIMGPEAVTPALPWLHIRNQGSSGGSKKKETAGGKPDADPKKLSQR